MAKDSLGLSVLQIQELQAKASVKVFWDQTDPGFESCFC